jgi:hypothetical protein
MKDDRRIHEEVIQKVGTLEVVRERFWVGSIEDCSVPRSILYYSSIYEPNLMALACICCSAHPDPWGTGRVSTLSIDDCRRFILWPPTPAIRSAREDGLRLSPCAEKT